MPFNSVVQQIGDVEGATSFCSAALTLTHGVIAGDVMGVATGHSSCNRLTSINDIGSAVAGFVQSCQNDSAIGHQSAIPPFRVNAQSNSIGTFLLSSKEETSEIILVLLQLFKCMICSNLFLCMSVRGSLCSFCFVVAVFSLLRCTVM